MKLAIVGTGYVGLVSGTCLSSTGVETTCIDIDTRKINDLQHGIIPIYEPELDNMVLRNMEAGRLRFATDLSQDIDGYDIIMCAVGTPPDEDGSADLHYVLEVARTVGRHINAYTLFVTKSTVPVGTGDKVRAAIREELDRRGVDIEFDVASNPEFLKEGAAIGDFMEPDRIVIGTDSDRARRLLEELYSSFTAKGHRLIETDIRSAEMIKYAANSMLATRISFMNEVANLCEKLGADIVKVKEGIGSDPRIGSQFLNAGIGYGGSCFPKDVKALIHMADSEGYGMEILESVERVNERQKRRLYEKFAQHYGTSQNGRTVAMWGLSFKPETDDMREAPSRVLAECLLRAGCRVKAYDPVAVSEARKVLPDGIEYCTDKYEAAAGADAMMLVTEWREFREPDWQRLKTLMNDGAVVFDGRNIYDSTQLQTLGFGYYGIGKR